MRPVCPEGSDGFVSSTAAPIATGWSDPVAGRNSRPLKIPDLSRRTLGLTPRLPFTLNQHTIMSWLDERIPWPRLLADDADAWRDLLLSLIPAAVAQLRAGFKMPHTEDRENPEAALYSAWPSFQRRFLEGMEFQDATNLEELTAHFLRITYNRSKRRERAEQQLQIAIKSGDGPLEVPDPDGETPDEIASRRDFLAYFRELVDKEVEALRTNPKKLEIVQYWLGAGLQIRQVELAQECDVSQAKVSRTLDEFRERVRRQLDEED